MPNVAEVIKSSPPVEDAAGAILEELVNSRKDREHVGNFAATVLGAAASGGMATKWTRIIMEGFQWLQSHDMIAPTEQAGFYFVTRQGQEIGSAANLTVWLAKQKGDREDALERALSDALEKVRRAESDVVELRTRAKSDIDQAIETAREEARSILNLARETAQGVSLDDVQRQFAQAAKDCLTGVWIWASLSVLFCGALVAAVILFLTLWEPSLQTAAQTAQTALSQSITPSDKGLMSGFSVYNTVLRVTLLTAIAAMATFCLRLLRAQLHLREQNLHRRRVANSMAAFLGATATPEQRDLILGRLAEAVTTFGNSGLLTDDDSMSPAKVILESVQRGIK
jgi:hypothetical protein